ncbi:MAG: hypothetical protein JW818_03225 [Pirellulales bacterium]|nr:hypothetical protein [Pirellulales bacterium]
MKRWLHRLAGVIVAAGMLALAAGARAETCKLELKKMGEPNSRRSAGVLYSMLSSADAQSFYMQTGADGRLVHRDDGPKKPAFSKVITKEPEKYVSKHPFRGVAKLGSQYYGFVIDASPPRKKEGDKAKKNKPEDEDEKAEAKEDQGDGKKKDNESGSLAKTIAKAVTEKKKEEDTPLAYTRVFFDLNHNGDLTDDKVIEVEGNQGYAMSPGFHHVSFPATDITLTVDGKKIEYAFSMYVYGQSSKTYSYLNAGLQAAVYREGKMTFGGKEYRVVVSDYNSNGQFDDASVVTDVDPSSTEAIYPTTGDMVFLVESGSKPKRVSPYSITDNDCMHFVGKMIQVNGQFHNLKVTPSGNELTIDDEALPTGTISNTNPNFQAVFRGPGGFLKTSGDASGKVPLPAGEWTLLSYTIRREDDPDKKKTEEEEKAKQEAQGKEGKDKVAQKESSSFLGALRKALSAPPRPSRSPRMPRSKYSSVTARASGKTKPVKVVAGETVEMPFGGPYRPIVSVQYRSDNRHVSLGLALVGTAEEVCSDMEVFGNRPEEPAFTITTPDGKKVATGAFEYG